MEASTKRLKAMAALRQNTMQRTTSRKTRQPGHPWAAHGDMDAKANGMAKSVVGETDQPKEMAEFLQA